MQLQCRQSKREVTRGSRVCDRPFADMQDGCLTRKCECIESLPTAELETKTLLNRLRFIVLTPIVGFAMRLAQRVNFGASDPSRPVIAFCERENPQPYNNVNCLVGFQRLQGMYSIYHLVWGEFESPTITDGTRQTLYSLHSGLAIEVNPTQRMASEEREGLLVGFQVLTHTPLTLHRQGIFPNFHVESHRNNNDDWFLMMAFSAPSTS